MLQFDLCHHHRGEVSQRLDFGRRRNTGRRAENAHGAETISISRNEWCTGVEPHAGLGQDAIAIAGVRLEILDHQHLAAFRNFSARSLLAGDRPMIDADPGLEPLPVTVCERNSGDRQVEDAARHP